MRSDFTALPVVPNFTYARVKRTVDELMPPRKQLQHHSSDRFEQPLPTDEFPDAQLPSAKTAFIVPYYGSWPRFFRLWIASAGSNPFFDFLILTDLDAGSTLP